MQHRLNWQGWRDPGREERRAGVMQNIAAGCVETCTLILNGHVSTQILWQIGENILVIVLNAACYAMVRGTKFGTIV